MIQLQPEERVYLLKRRHPVVLKLQLLPFILIFCFGLILIFSFSIKRISWPGFLEENFPEILNFKLNFILAFFFSLILPIIWCIIFSEIMRYYLTYWVVTNKRIIEVKLSGLFNVQYSDVELDKIQDMKAKIGGFLPSFFYFGDLIIETASEKGEFVLDEIGEPEITKQVIFEAKIDSSKTKT
jgi:hypothetical protein